MPMANGDCFAHGFLLGLIWKMNDILLDEHIKFPHGATIAGCADSLRRGNHIADNLRDHMDFAISTPAATAARTSATLPVNFTTAP